MQVFNRMRLWPALCCTVNIHEVIFDASRAWAQRLDAVKSKEIQLLKTRLGVLTSFPFHCTVFLCGITSSCRRVECGQSAPSVSANCPNDSDRITNRFMIHI